jgi:hypothetical protein
LAKYTTIEVGKSLNGEDLKRKLLPRSRRINPRDVDLARLIKEVSVGTISQVLPWQYDGKAATARAAANRAVRAAGASMYVSSRPDMPGVLLFSRVPALWPAGSD